MGASAMRLRFRCIAAIVGLLAAHALSAAEMPVSFSAVLELDSRAPSETLRYGDAEANRAQLWVPPGQGIHPVLVLVHGGCWLAEYDAAYLAPLASRLSRDGFAVFVPEYRRVGESGGGWPGSAADLVRAIDALAALDHPRLTLDRTILAGHSAGGHLALWAAAREGSAWRPPLQVIAALGLAAITDLDAYARGSNSCETVTPRFMGGMPEAVPQRYAAASPHRLNYRVPLALMRGGQDTIVGPGQLAAMPAAKHYLMDDAGHFDWVHPDTPAYERLRDTLFELLRSAMGSESL
jgi:acetyl esterase/lipase